MPKGIALSNYALSAPFYVYHNYNIATEKPHHPLVVQKINTFRVLWQCACGICNHSSSISFRDFVHFEILILSDPLHYISLSFYANTSAPHGFGSSFLLIPHAPLNQSETIQAFFPRISKGMFLFSAAS